LEVNRISLQTFAAINDERHSPKGDTQSLPMKSHRKVVGGRVSERPTTSWSAPNTIFPPATPHQGLPR